MNKLVIQIWNCSRLSCLIYLHWPELSGEFLAIARRDHAILSSIKLLVCFCSLTKRIMWSTWCAGVATLSMTAVRSSDSSGWQQSWLRLGPLILLLSIIVTASVLSLSMSVTRAVYKQFTVDLYHFKEMAFCSTTGAHSSFVLCRLLTRMMHCYLEDEESVVAYYVKLSESDYLKVSAFSWKLMGFCFVFGVEQACSLWVGSYSIGSCMEGRSMLPILAGHW